MQGNKDVKSESSVFNNLDSTLSQPAPSASTSLNRESKSTGDLDVKGDNNRVVKDNSGTVIFNDIAETNLYTPPSSFLFKKVVENLTNIEGKPDLEINIGVLTGGEYSRTLMKIIQQMKSMLSEAGYKVRIDEDLQSCSSKAPLTVQFLDKDGLFVQQLLNSFQQYLKGDVAYWGNRDTIRSLECKLNMVLNGIPVFKNDGSVSLQ